MKLPRVVVLLAAIFGLGTELKAQEWLEFETIDQSALPIVRARLNGSGGHRLVLDVGFKELILDPMLVDGAGMKLASQGEKIEIDYYGYKERVDVAYVQMLEIGAAQFELVRTLLVAGEDGTGIGGLRSYGRIGRDMLEPLRVTVHYPRRLLLMEPSPRDQVPAGGVTYQTVGRFLVVPARLDRESGSENVRLILDAGTSNTVIDRGWAADKGFAPKKATHATIRRIEVGGFESKELPVLLGDMHELPYEGDSVGVIGADLLNRLSVSYDFARDLVWLTSLEPEPEDPP